MEQLDFNGYDSCLPEYILKCKLVHQSLLILSYSKWLMVLRLVSGDVCFSESISLQRHVLSLDGPVVTASGFMDELAIVTHASECLPSDEQVRLSSDCPYYIRGADMSYSSFFNLRNVDL